MKRGSIKTSEATSRYLLGLALKLSKRGKRIYVTDIMDEVHRKLKTGEWSLDTLVH